MLCPGLIKEKEKAEERLGAQSDAPNKEEKRREVNNNKDIL